MLDQIDRVANMIDWGIRQGQRFYHHYRRADALRNRVREMMPFNLSSVVGHDDPRTAFLHQAGPVTTRRIYRDARRARRDARRGLTPMLSPSFRRAAHARTTRFHAMNCVEFKYRDRNYLNTTGTLAAGAEIDWWVTDIDQGNTMITRVGTKAYISSLAVKFLLEPQWVAGGSSAPRLTMRLLVIIDRQQNKKDWQASADLVSTAFTSRDSQA